MVAVIVGWLPISVAATSTATLIDPPMKAFYSLDGQHFWAVIQDSQRKQFLFRTTDGGESWGASLLHFPLWGLFFSDLNEGWGIASESAGPNVNTFCVHTSDSGRTWNRAGALTHGNDRPVGIAFDTKEHGWVVGEGDSGMAFVLETNDGGKHWKRLPWETEPASGLNGIRVHDGRVFTWSSGAGGSGIYELHPGALPRQVSDRETMNFAFVSGGTIVSASVVSVDRRAAETSRWSEVLEASDSTFWDLSFSDSANGCVVGGEIYCTDDAGETWSPRPQPRQRDKREGDFIYKFCWPSRARGWAVSANSIYETTDDGHTWHQVDFFDAEGKPLSRVRGD